MTTPENTLWHARTAAAAESALRSSAQSGLSPNEAAARLAQYGPNELIEKGIKSPWAILWEQLTAFLVLVLIGAAVLSLLVGEWKDSVAILVIVVLNALLGLSQEYRAEKAMAALKRLAVPNVRVRRGGEVHEIPARELVPGDIVLLEAGVHVPADGRLTESVNLKIQEAALTGESEGVEKDLAAVAPESGLADRRCMAYLGTAVTYGRGTMIVTDTGMGTELGRIATMLQDVEREPTPLQLNLDGLGRILTYVAVAIIAVVGFFLFLRGVGPKDIFLTAVSLAVAAVPEGLPAVVTISLALGAQRMLKRRVLIRKLTAVETLGAVNTICSDKTGTLTENRMSVVRLETSDCAEDFNDFTPSGLLSPIVLLAGLSLASDAVLKEERPGAFSVIGDPTEGALVLAAIKAGLMKPDLDRALPRVAEAPFDSSRKRMTTVHEIHEAATGGELARFAGWAQGHGTRIAFTKGSVDGLAALSKSRFAGGEIVPMTDADREEILSANNRLAGDGIRVLGLAFRPISEDQDLRAEALEQDLVFVGMAGMMDPVRAEVPDAVRTCQKAGIDAIMITGDHPLTARHIARQLGMAGSDALLTGNELSTMSSEALDAVLEHTTVYARVAPEHKLRIVETLQAKGHVVAMTGDGVNDAPALKRANIGVAMGITGTDVSRESSDMVLQDDNFATIVAAVEEGRVIYDNIRRFIRYIMSTNSGELWLMLVGPLLGMNLPLLPVQILWMNLVTDGLPALALALEPAERDVMTRPPRRKDDHIIGWSMGLHIAWVGLLMAAVTLGTGFAFWSPGDEASWHRAQTMIFTVVVLLQLGHAMAIRSVKVSTFSLGFRSNPALLGAVLLMILLQAAAVYVPVFQSFFGTTSLSAAQFGLCLLLGTSVFWAVELEKWIIRRAGGELA